MEEGRNFDPDLESGPDWGRPSTPASELKAFRQVRDHFLYPVLTSMQLKEGHRVISVDDETPDRPIQISWDLETAGGISWNRTLGSVGTGMVIRRVWPHGEQKFVGMIQIGGIVLDDKKADAIPTTWYNERKRSPVLKKSCILTFINHYLSVYGMSLIGQQADKEVLIWNRVPERQFFEAINKLIQEAIP